MAWMNPQCNRAVEVTHTVSLQQVAQVDAPSTAQITENRASRHFIPSDVISIAHTTLIFICEVTVKTVQKSIASCTSYLSALSCSQKLTHHLLQQLKKLKCMH